MTGLTIVTTDWTRDAERLGAVRRAVFIEEQGVPETLEWDELDAGAVHLLATTEDGTPIGCARLLSDGHIGRMAVLPGWRRHGIGRALLAAAIDAARGRGHRILMLSAQTHAAGFYAEAGFAAAGDEYEEAGIPHIAMQKSID